MKLSTSMMVFAVIIMATVVGLHEFKLIDLNSTPIIAKVSISAVVALFFISVWVWKTKESAGE
jgi:Na+/glutamate symporter